MTRTQRIPTLLALVAMVASLLALAPSAEAAGRISGSVVYADGSPAADVKLLFGSEDRSVESNAWTDSKGRYTSESLPSDHVYHVHVFPTNGHSGRMAWDTPVGTTRNFKLQDTGRKIYGTVTKADGSTPENHLVIGFDIGKKGPWSWTLDRTDSQGRYALAALDPSDRYAVFYSGLGGFGAVEYTSLGSSSDQRLDLRLGKGYWVITDRGVVHSFGDVTDFGLESYPQKFVSVARTGSGEGLWLLDEHGSVITLGDAKYHGDYKKRHEAGLVGRAEMVDIEPTDGGDGYYILDSAGGIHTFGDADFKGSIPGLRLAGQKIGQAEVMALAITRSGNGYWVLDDQGGMFTFGDATFKGSIPGLRLEGQEIGQANVIGLAPTASGKGYWLIDDVGGIFTFGDAVFKGSVPGMKQKGEPVSNPDMVDMTPSQGGEGYFIVGWDGAVYAFGDANHQGDLLSKKVGGPAAGIALAG